MDLQRLCESFSPTGKMKAKQNQPSPTYRRLVERVDKLIAKLDIRDERGDLLYYNENWLAINQVCENPMAFYSYSVDSKIPWQDELRSIKSEAKAEDLAELTRACIDGEWPYWG